MSRLLHYREYRCVRKQPLKNLLITAPTIMWVQKGKKYLDWQDRSLVLDSSNWLIIPAGQYVTFTNLPVGEYFNSLCISFFMPPPEESQPTSDSTDYIKPKFTFSNELASLFRLLTTKQFHDYSQKTQRHLITGFYEQLASESALRLLFPKSSETLTDRVTRYLSLAPGADHQLEIVAQHFSMSRATLHRKLKMEGSSFRTLLIQVRMGHAVNMLQDGQSVTDVALAMGYQSTERFSARFRQKFGLTPKAYLHTVGK